MYLLKKPHITKKSGTLNTQNNEYTFIVVKTANKGAIKKEITQTYGVPVLKVNTMRCAGKKTTRYTKKKRVQGQRASYKKAIVKVPQGHTIDVHNQTI